MQKIDFLIIGAQKAGTSSLMRFLEHNPEYFYVAKQECHFWSRDYKYYNPDGFAQYLANFSQARPNQIVGEKSPSYLASDKAAARIAKQFPKIKIIAILRDPADRAYSAYLHGLRIGSLSKSISFGEAIRNYKELQKVPYGDVISQGFYAKNLKSYYEQFAPEQILIIDFAEMVSNPNKILKEVLESGGYSVMVAQNGEEAVEVYSQAKDKIALVLSDMGLPKLGGWEAFQKMKQVNPRVKAILASGYLDPNLRTEMIKSGARDFIQKPYIPDQILRRVREVIDSTS